MVRVVRVVRLVGVVVQKVKMSPQEKKKVDVVHLELAFSGGKLKKLFSVAF